MIFLAKIENKVLTINDQKRLDKFIISFEKDCEVEVKITKRKGLRTDQQNASLHLWLTQLSDALNEKGFGVNKIIRGNIEMFWTPTLAKEILWRGLQKAMFNKKSTTQLLKQGEIDKIVDVIIKVITERTGGEVICPLWPSIETFDDYS